MSWMYRLQQRAGLTGIEGTAAVVVVLGLALGFGLRAWDAGQAPAAPAFYAAADAAFVAASTAPVALVSDAGAHAHGPEGSAAADLPGAAVADTAAADPLEDPAAVAEAAVRESSERSRAGKPPPVRTNLNTASAEELQRLPRIGPALAERILEYRRQHGRFRSAEEVNEVKGIGDKTLERLRPWIYV